MRALIFVLLASLTACFPHNASHRKAAKWIEGGAMVGGIVLLSQSKSGADCTAGPSGRDEYDKCRFNATLMGGAGLGLVLAGLVGFGITQITSGDGSDANKPPAPLASEDDETPKPTLPGLKKQ